MIQSQVISVRILLLSDFLNKDYLWVKKELLFLYIIRQVTVSGISVLAAMNDHETCGQINRKVEICKQ